MYCLATFQVDVLLVIHAISGQLECTVCYISNDKSDAVGDDGDANTDGIANAYLVLATKHPNYETVLAIKQFLGVKVNYSHTFELLPAILSIQTVCSFHLFDQSHYPNSERDRNMKDINTNAPRGDFHNNIARTNLLNGGLSTNSYDDVLFKHQTHWGDPRNAILDLTNTC